MDCDLHAVCSSSSNNNIDDDNNNNNRKLVHVIYYLSRDGRIDHPHLIEGRLLPTQDRLLLKDVKRWLAALRGVGMPDSYAWSFKRIYKSGYIWQDVSGSDALQPVQDRDEYVLLGCHLINEPFKGGGSCCANCHKVINVGGVHARRRLEFTNVGTTCLKDLHDEEEEEEEEEKNSSLIRRSIGYIDTNTTTTPKVYKAVCMISPEEAHQPAIDASTQTGESQRCSTDDQLEKKLLTFHPNHNQTLNSILIAPKPISSTSNSNSSTISQLILPPTQTTVVTSTNGEHSHEFTPSSWPSSTGRNCHGKTLSADGVLSTWRLDPRLVDANLSADSSRSPWSTGIGLRLGSTSPYENSTTSSSMVVQKSVASHARAKKQLRQLLLCGLRVDVNESKSLQQQSMKSLTDLQCNKGESNGSDSALDEYKSWFCSPLAFKLSDVNNSKGGEAAAANPAIGGGSPIFFRTLASSGSSEAPSLYSSASPTTRSSCLKAINGEEDEEQGSELLATKGSKSNEFNVASTHYIDEKEKDKEKERDEEEVATVVAGAYTTTKPNSTSSSSSCSNSHSHSHSNGAALGAVELEEEVFNTKICTSVKKHHGDKKKGARLQYDNIIASRGGKTDYPSHNNTTTGSKNNGHKSKSHWRRGLFGAGKKDIKYRCS